MSNFLETIKERAKADQKTIVLAEGEEIRTVKAADMILKEGIASIILLGSEEKIKALAVGLDISEATIINPETASDRSEFTQKLYEMRKAKGRT